MFKVKSGVAPKIMTEIFEFKDHSYDLRKNKSTERRIIKSCKYGSETVSNIGAKLWDILPEKFKKLNLFNILKRKLNFGLHEIICANYLMMMMMMMKKNCFCGMVD